MSETVLNLVRDAVTVTLFLLFVALIAWVFSPRRTREYTEAANLVFDESDKPEKY